jgi:hypothetical protein
LSPAILLAGLLVAPIARLTVSPTALLVARSQAASTPPAAGGYWLVASDGGIFAHGDPATTEAKAPPTSPNPSSA